MRRWLILGAALFALGAVALASAIGRLNGYLAAHREEIAAWAGQAIGRAVTFDAIRVSLRGGGSARLAGLRVADDPRFGDAPFLEATSAVVGISLLDAMRGALRVRSVIIDTPRLYLRRDADGWNVDTLAALRAETATASAGPAAPRAAPSPARDAAGVRPVHIDSLTLRDGTVTLDDRSRQPPTALTIEQVDLSLSQPTPHAALRIDGSAALFATESRTATIGGTLTPGSPPTADVDLSWPPLPLAALRPLVPAVGQYDIDGAIGGALHFAGPLAAVGGGTPTSLLPALSGTVELRAVSLALPGTPIRVAALSGALRFAPDAIELAETSARIGDAPVDVACRMAPPASGSAQCHLAATAIDLRSLGVGDVVLRGLSVDATLRPFDPHPALRASVRIADGRAGGAAFRQLDATATIQDDTAELAAATTAAFGGTVHASGRCLAASTSAPDCDAHVDLEDTDLATLLAALRSQAATRVEGRLDADLRLSTSGRDIAALRRSVRGQGSIRVSQGVVQGLNLAAGVLKVVPGIDGARSSGSRTAALLRGSGTRFERLSASVRIADERISSTDVSLVAEQFSVQAGGSAGFSGDLAARGTFRGEAPLIDDLAGGIPVLGRLAASTKGVIAIPFTVSGTLADPRVEPDLTAVASDIGHEASAGVEALFGAPDRQRGRPGGVLRQGLDKLFRR